MASPIVSQLWIFPIKSCKGFQVQSWRYGETGFDYDRHWMLVEERTHAFLTARTIPRMLLLEPSLDLSAGTLTILIPAYSGFPGSSHTIPIEPNGGEQLFDIRVWSSPGLDGWDVGTDALNRALSDYMGKDVRLIKKGTERRVAGPEPGWIDRALERAGATLEYERDEAPQVSFADAFPFLIVSEESLEDVQNRLLSDERVRSTPPFDKERWSRDGRPLEIHRFRGNIVVKGAEKWEEDGWGEVCFQGNKGEAETLYVGGRCGRCVLPSVDPGTGIRDKVVPDRVLRPFREGLWAVESDKVFFGVNALPKRSKGGLRVGDSVRVVARFPVKGEDVYNRPEDAPDF